MPGALSVPDPGFEQRVMAFVLFHLGAPEAALSDVRRALTPGGSLGTVTWAEDPELEATRVWEAELDAHGASDPTPVTPSDHTRTDTPEKMAHLFARARLDPVRIWIERFEHRWDVERFIALRRTFGRTMRKLESLEPTARAAFLERARTRLPRSTPTPSCIAPRSSAGSRVGPADFQPVSAMRSKPSAYA